VIRCRNCGASSEIIFVAELVADSETVFAAELAACSEPVLAADSTISLLGRNDLNTSNNFMV